MFRGSKACAVRCLRDRRGTEEPVIVTALTEGVGLQCLSRDIDKTGELKNYGAKIVAFCKLSLHVQKSFPETTYFPSSGLVNKKKKRRH